MLIRLSEDEKANYCMKLGEHLKRLRAIVGLTQDELARLSGISKERISRIENSAFTMRWAQFVNFIMIFSMHSGSKEIYACTKNTYSSSVTSITDERRFSATRNCCSGKRIVDK